MTGVGVSGLPNDDDMAVLTYLVRGTTRTRGADTECRVSAEDIADGVSMDLDLVWAALDRLATDDQGKVHALHVDRDRRRAIVVTSIRPVAFRLVNGPDLN